MTSVIITDQQGENIVEPISKALRVIQWEHSGIHDERGFHACRLWGNANQIASLGNADVLIQAKEGMHLVYDVSAGGNFEVYFYRSPTYSSAGTTINTHNKNEYSDKNSNSTITYAPTISDAGTLLFAKLLPGGTKTAGSGGEDGSFSREIILKSGINYLIRATNISGGTQPISITMEWYRI